MMNTSHSTVVSRSRPFTKSKETCNMATVVDVLVKRRARKTKEDNNAVKVVTKRKPRLPEFFAVTSEEDATRFDPSYHPRGYLVVYKEKRDSRMVVKEFYHIASFTPQTSVSPFRLVKKILLEWAKENKAPVEMLTIGRNQYRAVLSTTVIRTGKKSPSLPYSPPSAAKRGRKALAGGGSRRSQR